MTCSSGYIADASSARTPGQFLQAMQNHGNGKQHIDGSNFVAQNEKEEEDEEPTGFFGIMSEFKKGAGLLPSSNFCSQNGLTKSSQKGKAIERQLLQVEAASNQSLHQNTTEISRLAGGDTTPSRSIMHPSFLGGSITINDTSRNLSMPCVLGTIQIPAPDLELTQTSPSLEKLDVNYFGEIQLTAPDLELTQTSSSLEELDVNYNPLDPSIHHKLMTDLKVPVAQRHGYYAIDSNVPHIRPHNIVHVGPTSFIVKECKGKFTPRIYTIL